MPRTHTEHTITILAEIHQNPGVTAKELFKNFSKLLNYKDFYNVLFRLTEQGMLEKKKVYGELSLTVTPDGDRLLSRKRPKRDGVWKLVIFDIPEAQQQVRSVLRAKLKALGFKKWQNSTWVSPYALDRDIKGELDQLAQKFFIRYLEISYVNRTDDLEAMFAEGAA